MSIYLIDPPSNLGDSLQTAIAFEYEGWEVESSVLQGRWTEVTTLKIIGALALVSFIDLIRLTFAH